MEKNKKRSVFAWAIYDWANSAFATTIIAGFFPVFFNQFWSTGIDTTVSTARLGAANSIAGITVALLAPILGSIADKGTSRKRFLIFFAYMGVIMTTSLYMVSRGNWIPAIILYMFANIGFSGSNIFYDSLLMKVSSKRNVDFVSSLGYSLGYLGGGILFAFNVWITLKPELFGFQSAASAIRFSFLSVGVWWAVFTIPLIIFVKEKKDVQKKSQFMIIKEGLADLFITFKEISHIKNILLFLLAYWLYIDGVDTIIRMAVDYGMSIGFKPNDLVIALLITQFVGFPSALMFGFIGTKIGARRSIFIAIGVYLFVSIWGAFIQSKYEFYILAVIIGLVQGGIQALSRSFYTTLIPKEKSAKYFGFYNMLGRFAAVLGPVLMGTIGLFVRHLGYSSDTATRLSLASISSLFIFGGVILFFVKENGQRSRV